MLTTIRVEKILDRLARFVQFTLATLQRSASFRCAIDDASSLNLAVGPRWSTSHKRNHLRTDDALTASIERILNGTDQRFLVSYIELALRDLLYPFSDKDGASTVRVKPRPDAVANEFQRLGIK
jgi:hypothetical protein